MACFQLGVDLSQFLLGQISAHIFDLSLQRLVFGHLADHEPLGETGPLCDAIRG